MNLAEISSAEDVSVSSPDRVVNWIIRGILSGRYVPGQKLIEADLLQQLKVSRGPVREAFKRLHGEGIVVLTRHRGAQIRALAREEAVDLIVVLEVLTALIARLAATSVRDGASNKKLRETSKVLEGFCDPTALDNTLIGNRRNFYDALMTVGGNTQLPSIMPILLIHLLRQQGQPFWSDIDRRNLLEEYANVAEAVLDGDPIKAERAMKKHIQAARARLKSMPDDAFPAQ